MKKTISVVSLLLGFLLFVIACGRIGQAPNISYLAGTFTPSLLLIISGLMLQRSARPTDYRYAAGEWTAVLDAQTLRLKQSGTRADLGIGTGMLTMVVSGSITALGPEWWQAGTIFIMERVFGLVRLVCLFAGARFAGAMVLAEPISSAAQDQRVEHDGGYKLRGDGTEPTHTWSPSHADAGPTGLVLHWSRFVCPLDQVTDWRQ